MYLRFLLVTSYVVGSLNSETFDRATDSVKYLVGIIRHGARREAKIINDPIFGNYPDPNYGVGDLIPAGMRQHYLLGKAIANRYPNLFGKNANETEVHMQASPLQRTIMSGHAFFNGVYDLGSGPDIESGRVPDYNPPIDGYSKELKESPALPQKASFFPLITTSMKHGYVVNPFGACPTLEYRVSFKRDEINKVHTSDFKPLFEELKRHKYSPKRIFDKDEYDLLSASSICDAIFAWSYSNPEFKSYSFNLLEQCEYLNSFFLFAMLSGEFFHAATQKLNEKLVEVFEGFVNPNKHDNPKAHLFLGHDMTIITLLENFFPENWRCVLTNYKKKFWATGSGIDQTTGECIDLVKFTANLLFEVIPQEGSADHFVRLRFNNKPVSLIKDKTQIPISDFVSVLKRNTRSDYDDICTKNSHSTEISYFAVTLFIITSFMLLGSIVYLLFIAERKQINHVDSIYESL